MKLLELELKVGKIKRETGQLIHVLFFCNIVMYFDQATLKAGFRPHPHQRTQEGEGAPGIPPGSPKSHPTKKPDPFQLITTENNYP